MLGATTALALACVIYNQFDEKLTDKAQLSLDYTKHRSLPTEKDNAYFAMLGFNAGADQEMWLAGKEYWDKTQKAYANFSQDKQARLPSSPSGLPTPKISTCHKKNECIKFWTKELNLSSDIERNKLSIKYSETLNRYQQLKTYPHYATVFLEHNRTEATPIPIISSPIIWRALVGYELAFGKQRDKAAQEVIDDLYFWQNRMADADTVLSAMIATQAVIQDYQLLSEALAIDPTAYQINPALWQKALRAIPNEALDLRQAKKGEQFYGAGTIQNWGSEKPDDHNRTTSHFERLLAKTVYMPKASLNKYIELTNTIYNSNSTSMQETIKTVAAQNNNETIYCHNKPWISITNPAGKYNLCKHDNIDVSSYFTRPWQAEALRRLLAVQMQIVDNKTNNCTAINKYLEQTPVEFANPLDRTPPFYDANRNKLIFYFDQSTNHLVNDIEISLRH